MDKHNLSFEPMDVDQSAHSSKSMDDSINESNNGIEAFLRKINARVLLTPTPAKDDTTETSLPSLPDNDVPPYTTNIKKFHINIQKSTEYTQNASKFKIILCAALIMFMSAVAYQVLNVRCTHDIKPVELRNSLSSKLYGQTKAIDALIEGLLAKERSKLLILYGSTGVGKTFAASILMEHLGPNSNVYHYTMPSFIDTFTTDFMVGLMVCKDTIVIIDDLSSNDQEVKVHIDKLISKSENLGKTITVLLIYNNCNHATEFMQQCKEYFPTKIMDDLKQIKTYKRLIKFETLTEEHLRKCIDTELGYRKVNNDEFKKILKSFDVSVDGCKGVHTKIKVLDFS